MSNMIDNRFGTNFQSNYNKDISNAWWNPPEKANKTNGPWEWFGKQTDVKVNISLEKAADHVMRDMAGETAEYLVDKPELQEDYVIVITENPPYGQKAAAFRRSVLVEDMKNDNKQEIADALKSSPLIYLPEAELPEMPDDPELRGLADTAQNFLDKNAKLLSMFSRSNISPWT